MHAFSQTMVPVLCDDVMLEIFGNLTLKQLSKVAQCSRHFEQLAQYAFSLKLDGRLEDISDRSSKFYIPPNERNDIMRVFGLFAKHVNVNCCPRPWDVFDVNKLQSLLVRPSQIDSQRFANVKHLELICLRKKNKIDIDFGESFPVLKSLKLVLTAQFRPRQLPRGLHALNLNFKSLTVEPNALKACLALNPEIQELTLSGLNVQLSDLCDCMIKLGIHLTLKSLKFQRNSYPSRGLSHKLTMFQELRTLKLDTVQVTAKDPHNNFELLRQMPNLETLHITNCLWGVVINKTLKTSAAHVLPNLKELVLGPALFYRSKFDDFVAVMPSTCKCYYIPSSCNYWR